MRQLNTGMIFVCFAALIFVVACADTQEKKAAETPSQTAEETTETPQTAAASIEEVTLAVTGMT